MDSARFHFSDKVFEVWEFFGIDCEIFVVFHVIYVHVNHVERDAGFFVAVGDFEDVGGIFVAPAALAVTEGPFWGFVAFSD